MCEKFESQKREDSEKRTSIIRLTKNPKAGGTGTTNTGDISLVNANKNILGKNSSKQKPLNITVLHKNKLKSDLKEDERLFMQQLAKVNNSVVAGRMSTATNGSAAPSNAHTDQDASELENRRSSSKGTKTKLLIDAKAVKKRKLSIGSNRTGDGSKSHVRREQIKVVSPLVKHVQERASTVESVEGNDQNEGSGEGKRKRNISKPGKITLNKANIKLLVADRRGSNVGVPITNEAMRQKSKSLKRRQTPTSENNKDSSRQGAKAVAPQGSKKSGVEIKVSQS